MSNRNQKVVLNDLESLILNTNADVPQGSILGPLLVLNFINDIGEGFYSDMFIFAGDITLIRSARFLAHFWASFRLFEFPALCCKFLVWKSIRYFVHDFTCKN